MYFLHLGILKYLLHN